MQQPAIKTKKLANEIMEYLEQCPNAADTLENITQWWVTKLLYERSKVQVKEALEYLIDEKKMECISISDDKKIYRKQVL